MPNGYEANKFAVYKMNGTASFATNRNDRSNNFLFEHFKDGNSYENISTLINYLQNSTYDTTTRHKVSSTLTYACETENNHNNRQNFIGKVANDISNTEILVVIGYSFPLFNRMIDKRVFENSSINKIYIQDPNAESIIKMLKVVFKELKLRNDIEFEPVPAGNTFYFPAELY